MKTEVISKLRKVAHTIRKIAMAASTYQVTYTKPNTIALKGRRGQEYIFSDYNPADERSFKDWLETEVKDKEHLSEDSVEDILIQTYSEINLGKSNFNIKFYNFQPDNKSLNLVY